MFLASHLQFRQLCLSHLGFHESNRLTVCFCYVVQVLEKIIDGVENFGFQKKGWIESPLKGAEGNTEFLVCFIRTAERKETDST